MTKYKILDLFCGAGGFSKGFDETSKAITKIALDFEENAIETFRHNFPKSIGIHGNIKDEKIKENIIDISKKENIDIIIGGPPCQGFSNKGKKLGLKDERNFLFLEYVDLVNKIRPKIFVIENVKTLVSTENHYFIKEIKKVFLEIDYEIQYKILNAYDYGTPQKRERVFIIGKEKNIATNIDLSKCFPNKNNYKEKYTVKDAISDLAFLESGEGELWQNYPIVAHTKYQKEMRKNSKKLSWHIATKHKDITIKKLEMIPPECGKECLPQELLGKQKFNTTWGRLEWNEPSGTIDTRFDTPSNGKNSHPYLDRAITPREAARIQGFPDDFFFLGNKTAVRKQIGNAVPIPLAKAIANSIFEELDKEKGNT